MCGCDGRFGRGVLTPGTSVWFSFCFFLCFNIWAIGLTKEEDGGGFLGELLREQECRTKKRGPPVFWLEVLFKYWSSGSFVEEIERENLLWLDDQSNSIEGM